MYVCFDEKCWQTDTPLSSAPKGRLWPIGNRQISDRLQHDHNVRSSIVFQSRNTVSQKIYCANLDRSQPITSST